MTLKDFNQTLVRPDHHFVQDVKAEGAYLVVTFANWESTETIRTKNVVKIFLNDMGREVARTEEQFAYAIPQPEPAPVGRWYRFKNAFYLVLHGLEEINKCLKS